MILKTCTICKTPKSTDQFNRHGGHRDGLSSGCRTCIRELARKRRLNLPKTPKPRKTPKVKIVAPIDPKLIIDLPGIWEVQNRGKNYTTYNFTSPIDQTTFTFPSFREARKARESMRDVFVQQARFEAVVRQKTGKKPEVDEFDH